MSLHSTLKIPSPGPRYHIMDYLSLRTLTHITTSLFVLA